MLGPSTHALRGALGVTPSEVEGPRRCTTLELPPLAFNPTLMETGGTLVEIPPTSTASEMPAIMPPFASAGTDNVTLVAFGAAVAS
ncbi:MAG: hypothetical protein ACREML_03475, partial [Vulcanimicrobiaceae bacterium]